MNYLDCFNKIIFNGIKATSLLSMKKMFVRMIDAERPMLSIMIQLKDKSLSFEPPLKGLTSETSLEETLKSWIDSFIDRGSLVQYLNVERDETMNFRDLIFDDPTVVSIRDDLFALIDETCKQAEDLFKVFLDYSFLYENAVNQSFDSFLSGEKRVSSSTVKNFLNEQEAGRRFVLVSFVQCLNIVDLI